VRLLLGLLKGAVIGGLIGLGAYQLDLTGGMHWVTYGVVGFMVGMLVGRPFWSHLRDKNSTVVIAVLKAVVGYGVAVGIFAIVAKAWGSFDVSLGDETRKLYNWQHIFGAAIGALYGGFVEVDDAIPVDGKKKLES
jgi:hypothetical protein